MQFRTILHRATRRTISSLGLSGPFFHLQPTCGYVELTPLSGIHPWSQYLQSQKVCATHSKFRFDGRPRCRPRPESGAEWWHGGAFGRQRHHNAHICASSVHSAHCVASGSDHGVPSTRVQEAFPPVFQELRRRCFGAGLSRDQRASGSTCVQFRYCRPETVSPNVLSSPGRDRRSHRAPSASPSVVLWKLAVFL